MNELEIVFKPKKEPKNRYITNIVEGLTQQGINISESNFLKTITDPEIRIYHYNWFLNVHSVFEIFYKAFQLIVLVLLKKRIVYTLHNKMSHNVKYRRLLKPLQWLIINLSAGIIIHSEEESIAFLKSFLTEKNIRNKVRYIPHGNYIPTAVANSNSELRNYNIRKNYITFLFFGAVRQYKNIELLIDIFNSINESNIQLIIAGNPESEEYKQLLLNRISSDTIIPIFKFIDDELLSELLNASDCSIFPYNKESSLNSGSIYHALSFSNIVIAPQIGTVKDIPHSIIYDYDYDTADNHSIQLRSSIMRVVEDIKTEPDKVYERKMMGSNYMKTHHNWENITLQYYNLYRELQIL
jgi:beta-1,4-mannosyltransferase